MAGRSFSEHLEDARIVARIRAGKRRLDDKSVFRNAFRLQPGTNGGNRRG